jgi:hypothetical protein
MKKLSLVVLALATALAIAPAAKADNFGFTASGVNSGDPGGTAATPAWVSASGTLTGVGLGGSNWGITGASGVSITINGDTGSASLVASTDPWHGDSPNTEFNYSDVINTSGAQGGVPTVDGNSGLLFQITSGVYSGYFAEIYYDGFGDVLSASPDGSLYVPETNGYDVNFQVTPEPSSWLLLGTGLLFLGGFLYRKAKPGLMQAV